MGNVEKLVEKRRKELNMSQPDLCNLLGLKGGQFASNIERGIATWPDKYLPKLSRVLKISRFDLLQEYLSDRKFEFEKLFK